jgi:hypothetical protein
MENQADTKALPQTNEPLFFGTSIRKLVIMSVLTCNLYQLFWFWKNWRLFAPRASTKQFPKLQTLFAYFYVWPLFKQIRKDGQEHGMTRPMPAGLLAVFWIILELIGRSKRAPIALSLLSVVPLAVVQSYINELNEKAMPDAPLNSRFTKANWILCIIGGAILAIAIYAEISP